MKNLILYFSATGNTERMTDIIERELLEAGDEVRKEILHPDFAMTADLADSGRIIIAFPVLAWQAPVFVKRVLRRLPPADGSHDPVPEVAVISCSGADGGPAALDAASILRKKGYEITVTADVSYPSNWIQVGDVPKSDSDIEESTHAGDAATLGLVRRMMTGEEIHENVTVAMKIFGRAAGFAFGAVGRRFLGKLFFADGKCTGCGLCIRCCPSKTILRDTVRAPYPYWKMNCENCNRCMNMCPARAINTSILQAVLLTASIVLISVTGSDGVLRVLHSVIPATIPPALVTLVDIAVVTVVVLFAHLAAFGPIDFLVFRPLRRIPGLRTAFASTYTTDLRRYSAKNYKIRERTE